jgi:hypothetical protein
MNNVDMIIIQCFGGSLVSTVKKKKKDKKKLIFILNKLNIFIK